MLKKNLHWFNRSREVFQNKIVIPLPGEKNIQKLCVAYYFNAKIYMVEELHQVLFLLRNNICYCKVNICKYVKENYQPKKTREGEETYQSISNGEIMCV